MQPDSSLLELRSDEPPWSDPNRTLSPDAAHAVVESLRAVLPADSVLASEEELRPYECDGLAAFRRLPLAVALPRTEAEVREVMRTCREHDVPVIARGAVPQAAALFPFAPNYRAAEIR